MACENESSVKKLKEYAAKSLHESYEVNVLKNRNPRIMVTNISEEWEQSKLIESLKQQNENIITDESTLEVKLFKKNIKRKYNPYFAVLEVDVCTFNKIIKEGRLKLEWDNCVVNDGTYVKRCFKCLGFNHNSTGSTFHHKVCYKCGENHIGADCDSETFKCINCTKINTDLKLNLKTSHHAFDVLCPVYVRKMKIEKQKIF